MADTESGRTTPGIEPSTSPCRLQSGQLCAASWEHPQCPAAPPSPLHMRWRLLLLLLLLLLLVVLLVLHAANQSVPLLPQLLLRIRPPFPPTQLLLTSQQLPLPLLPLLPAAAAAAAAAAATGGGGARCNPGAAEAPAAAAAGWACRGALNGWHISPSHIGQLL
jgi:hypothetical protein